MKVSVIIPTYNRSELLDNSLAVLTAQKDVSFNDFEIIIVDDGSTDETEKVMIQYREKYPIKYIRIGHTGNVSYVRNVGIRNCQGALLLFLDVGVLVENRFISRLIERYGSETDLFLIHEIYGLFSPPSEQIRTLTTQLLYHYHVDDDFNHRIRTFSQGTDWIDRRKELFLKSHGNLSTLYAPWCYAWSCALTVSKALVDLSGGFDQSFMGWGSEDVDFALQCSTKNARFISTSELIAYHIPHETTSHDKKQLTNRDNRLKMHQKHYTFPTEIFLFTYSTHMESILSFFDNLALRHVLPEYPNELFSQLRNLIATPGEAEPKILTVGGANFNFLTQTKSRYAFYVNNAQKYMLQQLPYAMLYHQLGCSTPHGNLCFDHAVITDFYRLLPEAYIAPFIKEMKRISKKVWLLYDLDYEPYGTAMYNLSWKTEAQMQDVLSCAKKYESKCSVRIYELGD